MKTTKKFIFLIVVLIAFSRGVYGQNSMTYEINKEFDVIPAQKLTEYTLSSPKWVVKGNYFMDHAFEVSKRVTVTNEGDGRYTVTEVVPKEDNYYTNDYKLKYTGRFEGYYRYDGIKSISDGSIEGEFVNYLCTDTKLSNVAEGDGRGSMLFIIWDKNEDEDYAHGFGWYLGFINNIDL